MLSSRPLLIYDGDCGFCRVWIARWRRVTGERVEYAPYQVAAARHRTGAWWEREPRGLYCPALMLDGDRMVAAPPQLPGG